ncbi:PucR family transcriptional regulator [Clostridium sporogenes]
MQKKYDLYKKKYELYDSLFTKNTINEIVDTAENFLGNPIFILDTSYRIIARSNVAKTENSSVESHNGEDYLLSNTIKLMKKDKCMDTIYRTNTAFFHYSNENLIFCSIKVNSITIAYITILQSKCKFQKEDLDLTNILSKVLSIQMQKENLFISNSGLDEEYYLMDLLLNGLDSISYAKERLARSNFTLNKNLVILSIAFKQKYKDYRHNFALKQLIQSVKNIFKNCISAYYSDKIIFLISSQDEYIIYDNRKEDLLEFLNLNNLKCGVSIVFQNLLDIQDFFNQSVYALQLSSYMKISNRLNFFENYIEYYLFYIATHPTNDLYKLNLLNLVHPWIKKLIKFDNENNTQLFETLKTYLKNNRNANNTSKQLHIHRSTFFYRFNKIKSLIKVPLEDNNNLSKLELSFKILNYNGLLK